MEKYQITIRDKKETIHSEEIEAKSPKAAYEKYVALNKPIPFKRISVNWGMFGADGFDPPHYEGHVEESQNDVSSETKKKDTNSPSRSPSSAELNPLKGFEHEEIEYQLDKIYIVMDHIRWIGLSIGCMLALTFIVPQCTGG